ncbi:MAG: DUF938 domain-containing protein [Gammaproteobacteria bacterium]|nr:DUF938 domain-containing protein [Gammaproteobacteria bacterium]
MKPYVESCDQNCEPILAVIRTLFDGREMVLEIGSGTGQHAVYFAAKMPQLVWQTSDLPEYHDGISEWLDEAALPNARPPLTLDVTQNYWPEISADAVFSANAVHIMPWSAVKKMIEGVGRLLPENCLFVLYGPFNYRGSYTSDSNAQFDSWLKQRDPNSGIRDFEALDALAVQSGMVLLRDYEMPQNNRILCWQKTE